MQRAALLLSGAGATPVGQRRGPRSAPPALSPGGACALHDVPRSSVRTAAGVAGGGFRFSRLGRRRRGRRQEHEQELQHRRPETEGQKARGGAGTVTPGRREDAASACPTLNINTYKVKKKQNKNPWTIFMFVFVLGFFF